jgi:hypothetical protein
MSTEGAFGRYFTTTISISALVPFLLPGNTLCTTCHFSVQGCFVRDPATLGSIFDIAVNLKLRSCSHSYNKKLRAANSVVYG